MNIQQSTVILWFGGRGFLTRNLPKITYCKITYCKSTYCKSSNNYSNHCHRYLKKLLLFYCWQCHAWFRADQHCFEYRFLECKDSTIIEQEPCSNKHFLLFSGSSAAQQKYTCTSLASIFVEILDLFGYPNSQIIRICLIIITRVTILVSQIVFRNLIIKEI